MKAKSFNQYKLLRESEENKSTDNNAVGTKVSLGDGNQFSPFEISDDPKSENYGKNKNLAPIVRAFKQGANWGWSRDENTGTDKPVKITSKKLFLTGGAVRDHLLGKKPRNVELATSASPDEVYHLLKQNGFTYVTSHGNVKDSKNSPNQKEGSRQTFWVEKENKKGRPYVFGIQVNEDKYNLEVFMKTPRGMVDQEPESGTQAEDAAGRDFTINGMYIQLSNDNGPNKDLYDFFGGMHHLKSGKINAIGDLSAKIEEDPSRILRFVRMVTSYGDPKKISDEEKEIIHRNADKVSKLDRKYMMDEFKKGIDRDDVDPRNYLGCCKDLGVLDHLFPGKIIDTNFPKELSELGDKHMPVAFMLRFNNPNSLEDLGMESKDLQKIMFLIKSLGLKDDIDENGLSDLTNNYFTSGVPSRRLRDFAIKLGGLNGDVIDSFLNYVKQPRVKIFVHKDGNEAISDDFSDLVDPFSGEIDPEMADERRRQLELDSFRKQMQFMRPS
jgi:tRNA nucleotidyltransferase/poly(A) polymerase